MTLDDALEQAGVSVAHYFVGGLYAKATSIPAGVVLTQHSHSFDHLSALMRGRATVTVDGVSTVHEAPDLITIEAGKRHEVAAITPVVWVCLHATDETDPERIDATLISQKD